MKLAGETSELPQDVNVRRKHVIGGLCNIVGGNMANAFEFKAPGSPGGIGKFDTHVSLRRGQAQQLEKMHKFFDDGTAMDPTVPHVMTIRKPYFTVTRPQFVTDGEWYQSDHYIAIRAPIGSDQQLYSKLNLKDGSPFGVGIHRGRHDPAFHAARLRRAGSFSCRVRKDLRLRERQARAPDPHRPASTARPAHAEGVDEQRRW